MYCIFKNINYHLVGEKKLQYGIVLAVFDQEIIEIDKAHIGKKDDYLYNLLQVSNNLDIKKFLPEIKIALMTDYNFMIYNTLSDSNYFQPDYKPKDWTVINNEQKKAIKAAIKNTISIVQTELQTNEISIPDFIKKIANKTDKSKPWLYWEGKDENQNKIEFYAPNYNTEVTTLTA